ncbi:hypothetical protein IFM12275_01770 [Nocardia sputorum]|uniref:hypothetical protein n=1 Tax=Nocardia sputorum TaxID=2984338 RepID=UPI00249291DC|nr:hypothetical protein [Nocardia sputorum]BDT90201.1 hypothetical protein IFM12275_01770 [Nocardia sputorum]
MPNFNEDVVIKGHDLILKLDSGKEVARVDKNGSLTMRREMAGAAVQVLQFASGAIFGAPITVLLVGADKAPATFQVTGNIIVKDAANKDRIKLDGGGNLIIHNKKGEKTIELNGDSGDMALSNADAAEEFEVANAAEVASGMVMVLGENGKLNPCSSAYDQAVVGVVSGAGRYRPGIVFDRGEKSNDHRVPISVMGKVACRVDAKYGNIRVGDLLTTSPNPGYAMKAADQARAFGTIIGKALGSLDEGNDLVPMLIGLQ